MAFLCVGVGVGGGGGGGAYSSIIGHGVSPGTECPSDAEVFWDFGWAWWTMSLAWKNAVLDWSAFGEVGGGVEQQALGGGRVSHTYLAPHRGLLSTGALSGLFLASTSSGAGSYP